VANVFIFYLEYERPPVPDTEKGVVRKKLVGILRVPDGAAARRIVESYLETVAEEVGATVVLGRLEIHGVTSGQFQVWDLQDMTCRQ
jgi:hypothetical protein